MKINLLMRAVKSAMIASAIFAVSLPTVYAAEEAEDAEDVEEIVVTGSRIKRDSFAVTTPMTIVDAALLEDRGFTNVADALNEVPSFGVPGNSTQGGQSSFSVGQNFVNFFGLGSQRTLTLVNGRRFVSSNSPTNFAGANAGLQVDLNVIPTGLVERIETIALAGAPIYGSDAIAGTVNVILKDDFEGLEFNGSYGISGESDLKEKEFGVLLGGNFADGRGNLTASVEHTTREGLIESDRDHLAAGWQYREPNPAGDTDFVLVRDAHANIVANGGAITPGGGDNRLIPNFGIGNIGGNYFQFAPDGTVVPYDVGTPTGNPVWSVGGDGLFLPDVTNLFTPLDRTLFNVLGNYEITDNIKAFGELFYANSNSTELANQPAYQTGLFGDEAQALLFQADHPLLTAAAQQSLADLGLTEFFIQRASTDLRPNGNAATSELHLWRGVAGVEGEFEAANRNFNWDVSYNIGNSDSDSAQPDIDNQRFFYALDVVLDADGNPACRVTVDPASRPDDPAIPFGAEQSRAAFDDCVPLDIFGEGRASQEALEYISALSASKSSLRQTVFSANLGFDVLDLPAGDLDVVVGYAHRKEQSDFIAGGFLASSLGRNGPVSSIGGQYSTDELYTEFYAPIIGADNGYKYLQSASIEGAYRNVDNSLAGSDNTWTIGGRISPVEDIELRANRTRAVRAPAVTELFLPTVQVASFAADPCDATNVNEGPNPAARRANCIADGITDPDSFTSEVRNASRQGTTGGNLNLKNEKSDSWSIGFIAKPRWVEGLTVALDYVNVDITDAIESFTLTQIMESCYDQTSFPNDFCSRFRRQASGQLQLTNAFETGQVNAGQRTLKAYTLAADYGFELAGGDLDLTASFYLPQEDISRIQESVDDDHAEIGNANIQGLFSARYSRDKWSVLLQPRLIGEAIISNNDRPDSRDVLGVGDEWLFNAGFTYDFNDSVRLQFNIDNLFDEQPPIAAIASGNDGVYDNVGRYFRGGINVKL